MILFGVTNLSAANECKLRVEFNAGSALFPNNLALPEQTYQPGGWQSFSQEHITKIENTGRNDMLIRTRNVVTNQIAEYHTVNSGPLTIWFPLPNFTGTALHQVRCLNYSTIHDATDIIAEFGGGAQNLINQTETAATQMVQDSKNSLLAMADPVTYQHFMQDLNQKRQQVEQKWQELQQLASEGMDAGDQIISEHFPELHAAIEASTAVTIDLQRAILETHGNNLGALQQKLRDIDRKLGISDLAGEFASINPEEHFPELFALGKAACEIDPSLFNEAASEMNRFHDLFSRFMEELANRADLPAMPFTQSDIDQLNRLLTQPPCLDELVEARRLLADDLQSFVRYVQDIQANLEIWQRRWFIRGHEELFQESQRLAQTSAELAEHLVQQHTLEQEANQAKREMDDSHKMLGQIHGRGGQSINLLVVRIDLMVPSPDYLFAPNDEEQIKQQIEEHQKTIDNYEAAVLARENNLQQIQRLSADWLSGVSSLAASVSSVRITAPTVRRFIDLANNQPSLNLPASSVRLLRSCLTDINQNLQTASAIFSNGFRTFYDDLANFADSMIPEQLGIVLQHHHEIFSQLNSDIQNIREMGPVSVDLLQSSRLLLNTAYTLSGFEIEVALTPSPAGHVPIPYPNFFGLEDELKTIYEQFMASRERFNLTMSAIYPDIELYIEIFSKLNSSLEENRSDLTAAAMELQNYSVNLERLLHGLLRTGPSISECVAEVSKLGYDAVSTFDQRKIVFELFIQEMLPDPIPDEVRSGITNLLSLTAQQISQIFNPDPLLLLEDAHNRRNTAMQVAFAQIEFLNFTAFLQAGDQDLAMEFLDNAVNRIAEIEIETTQLRAYLQQILETHREAVHELELLKEWARSEPVEVVNDIHELSLAALNLSPVLQMTDQLLELAPLWLEAKNTTPARLQSLFTNEIAQRLSQLRPQVENGMLNFLSHSAAAANCAQDVIAYHTSIAGHSVVNSVNQALSNTIGSAPVVFSNLQNLLNPVQSVMTSVEQVLNSGKSLIEDAKQAPQTAKSNFDSAVSSSKNLMQQSMVCVNQRSDEIQSNINELNSLFAEIEGFQTVQPVQMQFISFPIQN
ncbi:MAG: hypothetical protein EA359_16795 [Balneolaceae bacterium]|nr:MAG: hypothetical protein EA359_16795 [Balneolaceae bacterium]